MIKIKHVLVLNLLLLCFHSVSFAKEIFNYEGQIDFVKKEIEFGLGVGPQKLSQIKFVKNTENDYKAFLNLKHLKASLFDLSSEIENTIRIIPDETNTTKTIKGEIKSRYTLLDYQPIKDISGSYEINNKKLNITSLSIGDVRCSGSIDLFAPFGLNLIFDLTDINMDSFLSFWIKDKKFDSDGLVSGNIRVMGEVSNIKMKGNLKSSPGFIKKLYFDSITLNAEGVYPDILISDSTITQADGYTSSISGLVNLSDSESFKQQIRELTLAPVVSGAAQSLEWTIRRSKTDDKSTTEIKYMRKPKDIQDPLIEEDMDILGVEKKVEF